MGNSQLPMNDTDFWWLRYVLGIAIPIALTVYGAYSIVTLHSYTYGRRVGFIPVEGEQAMLMGIFYSSIALALFANCYAQYHEKMGNYYQWMLGTGALLAGGSFLWCWWIFLAR
jgi:hypothetical protein